MSRKHRRHAPPPPPQHSNKNNKHWLVAVDVANAVATAFFIFCFVCGTWALVCATTALYINATCPEPGYVSATALYDLLIFSPKDAFNILDTLRRQCAVVAAMRASPQ